VSEWISCDSRLPPAKPQDSEISEDLLAYVIGHGGYVRMITAFYSFTDEDWMADDGEPLEAGERVTHWHPLPDPPEVQP
jgi:hypothetical protein